MGQSPNGARRGILRSLRSLPIKGPELHSPSVRKLTLHQSKFNGHIDEHLDMGRHVWFDLNFVGSSVDTRRFDTASWFAIY